MQKRALRRGDLAITCSQGTSGGSAAKPSGELPEPPAPRVEESQPIPTPQQHDVILVSPEQLPHNANIGVNITHTHGP